MYLLIASVVGAIVFRAKPHVFRGLRSIESTNIAAYEELSKQGRNSEG